MTVTIRDLAQMANTSTATVSRVLSNKPGVANDKRKNIQQLVDKLGYSPNKIAQSLALQKSHVLGIIASDLKSPVFVDFLRQFNHLAREQGYQVLIADSERDVAKEKANIDFMRSHRAEGLLIFPVHECDHSLPVDHFLQLKLQKFPFVLVGKLEGYHFDYVASEEQESAYRLTQLLLEMGHRSFGFIGNDLKNRAIKERLIGVQKALHEVGGSLHERDILAATSGWEESLRSYLSGAGRPSALIIANDLCTLIAYRIVGQLGISMPSQLSIAGFNDNLWTGHLVPAVTVSADNNTKVGHLAMELLLKRIEEPQRDPEQYLVPQEIIHRESVAAPC